MNKAIAALALTFFLAAPGATFAATYQYVNTSGFIAEVEALNADQAIRIAVNRTEASGVILVPEGMNGMSESTRTTI